MVFKRFKRKSNYIGFLLLSLFVPGLIFLSVSYFVTKSQEYTVRSHIEERAFAIDTLPSSVTHPSKSLPTCPECKGCPTTNQPIPTTSGHKTIPSSLINCSIPSAERVTCIQREDDVYMPVSFINSFFEVYGKLGEEDGRPVYEFQYSYGTLYTPQAVYHPGGVLLNFNLYNVEGRSKIMCVTASEGVPLTNQWSPEGYHYAITIAQFGLSHHAKAVIAGENNVMNRANKDLNDWTRHGKSKLESRVLTVEGTRRQLLFFEASASLLDQGPVLKLSGKNSSVCLDVKLLNGTGGITVKIRTRDGSPGYVHFDGKDRVWEVQAENNQVFYGMGLQGRTSWKRIARNIAVDWNKAFSPTSIRLPTSFDRIMDVTLHGTGYLDNVTIALACHVDHLLQAADWLMAHQDSRGGWPTSVDVNTGPIHLRAGWYSAMAQGQAMSTLVRAHNLTGRQGYLDTAVKALHLYTVSSTDGGVKARFLDSLDWYEEYPTTPHGSFVLNGFIFSLLGLYDVMETVTGNGSALARRLWESGLGSLKAMLGMFDTGFGTLYDLRHVSYHEQPNRARWDYHLVHISLIQQLYVIDGDPIFQETVDRWVRYLHGERSKHN